ncbi:Transcriptional activator [Taxawa tesnikishii (nom. ined.)]|nr:Transcriptional activator [Dothideales sp. JES 119]
MAPSESSSPNPLETSQAKAAAYVETLEARLRAYEAVASNAATTATQNITPSTSGAPISIPNQRTIRENSDIEINPLIKAMADVVISPSGKIHYLGNSSSTTLGLRLRDIVRMLFPGDGSLDIEREHSTYNPAALRPRRPSVCGQARLPPYPFALRLFAAQYTYIGTIFAFVPKETFEARLQKAYEGPPDLADREACLAYAQVLVILAFGQMYSVNQWSGFEGPPGFEYFTLALQFLPDIHEDGSILFVEVLALVGYFMQNLNRRDAAFLYLGVALRMAVSLALHQEVFDPQMDEASIMTSLQNWHRELPDTLRFDPDKLGISRESVSTFLHYHQCINMTARPLLFHVVQKRLENGVAEKEEDWKQGLTATTVGVIETCIAAARDTITMMAFAAQKDLVATYGYMDGEHAFSAATVLVMVCVAFPYNARDIMAMDTALELLRSMTERGNSHMGARYQLLLRLRSLMVYPTAGVPQVGTSSQAGVVPPFDSNPAAMPNAGACPAMEMPSLPAMDNVELEEMFAFDVNATGDFGLWEAGYTNPDVDMEHEMSQWNSTVAQHLDYAPRDSF